MNIEHEKILSALKIYLEKNPSQRFTQALFNLKINEFVSNYINDMPSPFKDNYEMSNTECLKRVIENSK